MRKQIATTMLVLLLAALLPGCGPTPPTAAPTTVATTAALQPTAAPPQEVTHPERLTAGDPYTPELGNGGYDVQHYILRLTLDPSSTTLDAHATIEATSTVDQLDQVALDFIGFAISAVTLTDAPAPFSRQGDKLIVSLPEPVPAGVPFTLHIAYHGEPTQEPSAYVPFVSHLGLFWGADNTLFVVAEPDGARYWFPANDHPRDKATFRFELTVPAGLIGVANGTLVETRTGQGVSFPDGRAGDLYVWEHNAPMATAFATVAVGDYVRIEDTSPAGIPLRHYVFPEQEAAFKQATADLGEMIDWMGDLFGPYPFEAFGFVMVRGLGGASLETQTMVILSEETMDNEDTLSHELAHMWFGDWVSVDSWGDIWRSEGFATYVQLMWAARDDPTYLEQTMASLSQVFTDDPSGYPLDDPPPRQLFGRDSYIKGAALAHALHQEMGDEAFFDGLRTYFQRYGGGAASHAEFQAVLEEAAGKSLEDLFATWFR